MSKLDVLATIDAHIITLCRATYRTDEETASWLQVIIDHLTNLADDLESEAIAENLASI